MISNGLCMILMDLHVFLMDCEGFQRKILPPKKIGAVRQIIFCFGLRPAHGARPATSSR